MDPTTRIQVEDDAVYISHSANIFEKAMNPNIPSCSPAMGQY